MTFSQPFLERDKVVASTRGPADELGMEKSVALWGDYAAAGAARSNINGNDAGAVFVYERSSTDCPWNEIHAFVPTSTNPSAVFDNDHFGTSVAMNDNYLVIGAPGNDFDQNGANFISNAGAVFIYERLGSTWSFMAKVVPNAVDRIAEALFGQDVDIVDNMVIVGANGENSNQGAAYIFEFNGSWIQQNRLTASDGDANDEFGYSVAISYDWAVVGAPGDEHGMLITPVPPVVTDAGSAYVFLNNGNWAQNDKVTVNGVRDQYDWFGYDVDMDGVSLIVNEFSDDDDMQGVTNPDALATNIPGLTGQSCCAYGSVHYFDFDGNNWVWNAKIQPSNVQVGDWFGSALALDGNFLAIGAYRTSRLVQTNPGPSGFITNAGAIYVFELVAGTWQQIDRMTHSDRGIGPIFTGVASQDYLGKSVAIHQNRVIASAPWEDEDDAVIPANPVNSAGSAYIFELLEEADQPLVTASPELFCAGYNTTISLTIDPSANLNDATDWEWALSQTATPFFTGPACQIQVNPTATTTYYVRGIGCGVPDGPWGQVTVTSGAANNWHQYTENSSYGDAVNDVITDDDGNVYVTGTFKIETTLNGGNNPDIVMSHPLSGWSAFVAKYNTCGDLLWADYSVEGDYVAGKSITLDQGQGIVYVTGDASLNPTIALQFNSTGASVLNATSPSTSYIAAFEMGTGQAIYVDKIQTTVGAGSGNFETIANAIVINESNGDIYVGGAYHIYGNPLDAFVQKYTPTGGGINALISEIMGVSGHSEVNDLDYFEGTNPTQLAVIGDYRQNVRFDWQNFSTLASGVGSTINNFNLQGFFLLYEEAGGSYTNLFQTGSNGGGPSTGEGVAFDNTTGKVFLTGNYTKDMINPYNFGINSLLASTYPNKGTYLIGYDVVNVGGWAHDIIANDGSSNGVSVTADDGIVYFTGYFSDNIVLSTGVSFSYTGISNARTYIVSLDDLGGYNWGNVTTDLGISAHSPSSIAVHNGDHVYVCGSFMGDMDYLNSSGSSPLASSGVAFASNGFVLRAEKIGGQLRIASKEDDEANTETFENSLDMIAQPNPSNDGRFTLILNQPVDDGVLKIMTTTGQRVYEVRLKNEQVVWTLDLSDQKSGIYFITIAANNSVISKKVLITP